jgi:hypothetical protein
MASLIMLDRSNVKIGFAATLLASTSSAYSFGNYVEFLGLNYWNSGVAIPPNSLVGQWSFAPAAGWSVLFSIIVAIIALSALFLRCDESLQIC